MPSTATRKASGSTPAIGFFGESGSGKTTLIEHLIAHFHAAGLSVAAVKHAHHGFDIDRPGKDSYRFRQAGAAQVLVASAQRWVLMSEERATPAGGGAALERQLARFDACDLILVEGYRGQAGIPFIHVWRRPDPAAPPRAGRDETADRAAAVPGVVAVAVDPAQEPRLPEAAGAGIPVLDLNDIAGIAAFIVQELNLDVQSC